MTFVAALEPTDLWTHFDTILTIPRGSKNEDAMRRAVIAVAESAGLAHGTDAIGNLVIRKPASAGRERVSTTILQSHLDMVNEKNADHVHDFTTDPIVPLQVEDYLTADGTTLGSDNGIGVAAMLAIAADPTLVHGPLELLFTIDEETGLTGAAQLDPALLEGRRLINLDSEEEGILYVGCAGGGDSQLRLPLGTVATGPADVACGLSLTGLKGGHSGCDIHLRRGNAVKLLTRALAAVRVSVPFRLGRLEGGSAHNAIPREAFGTVVLPADDLASFTDALTTEVEAIRHELGTSDPGLSLTTEPTERPAAVWSVDTTATALRLLEALPHGVEAMSQDIPGLVETSANVATVAVDGDVLRIGVSSRSSVDSALEALRRRIRAAGELAGASAEEDEAYPGWQPDVDSELLGVVKATHERVVGSTPEVAAIHAGLECGILGRKVPGLDMISFGPVIQFPHSPDERVHIASVGRFYRLLTATLEALADE